ncbi:hypothetical protein [Streptomyces laurentii]|uniref:hypothetical protein n=1 Tax=Streptomyces laurentii TaxID=39478 RepID=UPI0036B03A74
MQKRSNARTPLLFRSRPALGTGLMVLGATLLQLGLPGNWIDLGALVLAAMTVRPADATEPRPPARKPRPKNRSTRRRTPRGM